MVTEEVEGRCRVVTGVSFHVPLNGAAIRPHLLASRWIDPARPRSRAPPSLRLALSIRLVNMCKQTARGIDKTHPGGFISTSFSQNITPPPLK